MKVDVSALREECPICLEPTHLQGVQCSTCRTWFHAGCVVDYLTSDHTRTNSCPMCTAPWGDDAAESPGSKTGRSARHACSPRFFRVCLGTASIVTLVLLVLLL